MILIFRKTLTVLEIFRKRRLEIDYKVTLTYPINQKKAFTIKYCLTTDICDKLPIVKGRVRFLQVCWKFQEFLVISYEIKI